MHKQIDKKQEIKDGLKDAIPIMAGYLTASMAFGLLAKNLNIPIGLVFLFSLLNFAGSSQFMAMNFMAIGAGIGEMVLTAFLINFRYLLMSASVSQKLSEEAKKIKPIIAFGVTDEVFSVSSFRKGKLSPYYMLPLQWASLSAWVGGSVLGYALDGIIPLNLRNAMMLTLYALFISIIISEAKKTTYVLALVIGTGAINIILNQLKFFAESWNMVIAIIAIALIGTLVLPDDENSEQNEEIKEDVG